MITVMMAMTLTGRDVDDNDGDNEYTPHKQC